MFSMCVSEMCGETERSQLLAEIILSECIQNFTVFIYVYYCCDIYVCVAHIMCVCVFYLIFGALCLI